MRVAIAGAGSVGRSIASELIENGHEVLVLERDPQAYEPDSVPGAQWLLADACELSSLEQVGLESFDVSIASTGDDKANLVHALLAKTEFSVPRTVARVNQPRNEWMFGEDWGVDVAVSTPRLMSALVEEAVAIGDLVRLFTFRQSNTDLVELTLPTNSPCVGRRIGDMTWPTDTVLVAVVRDGRASAPHADGALEGGDELLFVTAAQQEQALAEVLAPKPTA